MFCSLLVIKLVYDFRPIHSEEVQGSTNFTQNVEITSEF